MSLKIHTNKEILQKQKPPQYFQLFRATRISVPSCCSQTLPSVATSIMKYVLSEGKTKHMSFKQSPKHVIFIRENVKTLNGAHNIVEILRGIALNEKAKI